jgi:hypothetical protein
VKTVQKPEPERNERSIGLKRVWSVQSDAKRFLLSSRIFFIIISQRLQLYRFCCATVTSIFFSSTRSVALKFAHSPPPSIKPERQVRRKITEEETA